MNLETLRKDSRFFVFGKSDNTAYADGDLDRNLNRWYRYCIASILKVNGDWQINGDILTTDIVANQREYILPSDILKLNEVYIKSTSVGELLKAGQRDPLNMYVEPESYHPATPEFDLLDNSMFIYIPESTITDVTKGIEIHAQLDITELSLTTDKPNISEAFQRLLSLGAAYDYCIGNEMPLKAKEIREEMIVWEQKMMDDYSKRSLVSKTIINPKKKKYY